jgi:hypothetical protein
MFRVIGLVSLLALGASAVHAEEDRSAYSRAQAKLTEQLNAVIAKGIEFETPAPPAKLDASGSESALAKADRASS